MNDYYCQLQFFAPRVQVDMLLTNFGRVGVGVEKHTVSIWYAAGATEEAASYRLARLHSLEGEVSSHGLRDVIAVVTILNALLSNVLYLSSPVSWLADSLFS